MIKQLLHFSMALFFFISVIGCASRLPRKDFTGKPIPQEEIEAKKKNSNFALYIVGGGALSFGASFFLGSLADRAANDSEDNTALWVTTGVGTALGMAFFAHTGRVRDYNLAVLAARGDRRGEVTEKLANEKERRDKIEEEKLRLLREREKQEAERKKILEKLKKKNKNQNQ